MDEQESRLDMNETTSRRLPRRGGASSRMDTAPDERSGVDRTNFSRDDDFDARDRTDEDDRFEAFRDSFSQSVLPNLPRMEGYHVCWLTTTNPRDSIAQRIRMGYELIRIEDCPGFDTSYAGMKTGDYAGIVAVNEMVGARIPLSLYQRYMRHVHHDEPLSEEQKLRSMVESMQSEMEQRGSYIQQGDGTAGVVQRASTPSFLE